MFDFVQNPMSARLSRGDFATRLQGQYRMRIFEISEAQLVASGIYTL